MRKNIFLAICSIYNSAECAVWWCEWLRHERTKHCSMALWFYRDIYLMYGAMDPKSDYWENSQIMIYDEVPKICRAFSFPLDFWYPILNKTIAFHILYGLYKETWVIWSYSNPNVRYGYLLGVDILLQFYQIYHACCTESHAHPSAIEARGATSNPGLVNSESDRQVLHADGHVDVHYS